jgi:hypothetical protein
MGITYFDARLLCSARLGGASFRETLSIAHLALNLHEHEVAALRAMYSTTARSTELDPLHDYVYGGYSDAFLKSYLGVSSLSILDYSDYEGATIVHDLNHPVPEHLHRRFDAVIDGGSLEHIFNFPVAIANLMKMVKTGGRVFLKSPANNLCGHGFYQFSPELMFRVFEPRNGFELERVVLLEGTFPSVEETPYRHAYEVTDPEQVRTRVGLVSRRPVVILVQARKIADLPVFAETPLQSDYVSKWQQPTPRSRRKGMLTDARSALFRLLPGAIQTWVGGQLKLRRYSFSNREFYRRLPKP